MSLDTGVTTAMLEGTCLTPVRAERRRGARPVVHPRRSPATGARSSVPEAGRKDTTLPFDWVSSARPPDWAREPLLNAADDATTSTAFGQPDVRLPHDRPGARPLHADVPGLLPDGHRVRVAEHADLLEHLRPPAWHGLSLGHAALVPEVAG